MPRSELPSASVPASRLHGASVSHQSNARLETSTHRRLSRPDAPRATGVRKSNSLAIKVGAASGSHVITASASARDSTKPSFCGCGLSAFRSPGTHAGLPQPAPCLGRGRAAAADARTHPCQLQDELPGVSFACHVGGSRVEGVKRHLGRIVARQDLGHQEAVREVAARRAGRARSLRSRPSHDRCRNARSTRVRTAARSSRCRTGSVTAAT